MYVSPCQISSKIRSQLILKCVYIRHPGMGQMPLCQACEKRGYQQCSPHIKRTRREEVGPASADVPSFDLVSHPFAFFVSTVSHLLKSGAVNPIAALNIQSRAREWLANSPTAMEAGWTGPLFSAQDNMRWQFTPDPLALEMLGYVIHGHRVCLSKRQPCFKIHQRTHQRTGPAIRLKLSGQRRATERMDIFSTIFRLRLTYRIDNRGLH